MSSASMLAGGRLIINSHVWGLPGTLSPRSSDGGVSSCRSSIGRVGTRWVRPREVGPPSPMQTEGGGGGRAPSTPPSGIGMPGGPLRSRGGDIDPSRTVALAERVETTMMKYLAMRKRGCP